MVSAQRAAEPVAGVGGEPPAGVDKSPHSRLCPSVVADILCGGVGAAGCEGGGAVTEPLPGNRSISRR